MGGLRKTIGDAVEALIGVLDHWDGDPDLEDGDPLDGPDSDLEPSLGATSAMNEDHAWAPPRGWHLCGESEDDDPDHGIEDLPHDEFAQDLEPDNGI